MDPDLSAIDGDIVRTVGVSIGDESDDVVALSLGFSDLTLRCEVVRDDDTLAVTLVPTPDQLDPTPEELADLVGSTLVFAWPMVNTLGYPDGLQLHFAADVPSNRDRVVQIMVIASSIRVARVVWTRLERPARSEAVVDPTGSGNQRPEPNDPTA